MAKYLFKTGKIYIDGVWHGVTGFDVGTMVSKVDVTDSQSGGYKSHLPGIASAEVTIEIMKDVTVANFLLGAEYAGVLIDFEGFVYAGTLKLFNIADKAVIDNALKITYNGTFEGEFYQLVDGAQLMVNANGFNQTSWDGTGTPDSWSVVGGAYEELSIQNDSEGDYIYMEIVDQAGVSFEQTFGTALKNATKYLCIFKYSDASFDPGAELTVQVEGTQDDVIFTLDNTDASSGRLVIAFTTTSASTKFVIKDDDSVEAYWLNIRSIDLFEAVEVIDNG